MLYSNRNIFAICFWGKSMENHTTIRVNDFMKEKKAHGNLEYPLAVYHVDLNNLYMGFVRWHWHEEIEIDVVTEGRMECMIGNDSFILEKGDYLFINQNVMHSIHPIENEPGCFDAIVFHPMMLFNYTKTYLNAKFLLPIVSNTNLKYFIMDKSYTRYAEVNTTLSEVVEVNTKQEFGYELISRSCLCRFWLLLLQEFRAADQTVPKETLSLSESRTKEAIIYIQEHYNEGITLDEIATAIHVSKSECCRCFKRSLHTTPFEYLMKYRIFMASMKIRQNPGNSLSFSEIAASVGFNNVSYFNKLFKLYLKCTPSQYRKNLQNGEPGQVYDFPPKLFEEHATH